VDADEEGGEPVQTARAVGEDLPVVVAEAGDDVQPDLAVRRDRLVQPGVERRDERGGGVIRLSGAKTDAGLVARRRHQALDVDTEIHPGLPRRLLKGGRDGRLTRARDAVQDDDPAWLDTRSLFQGRLLALRPRRS
jgi:hypothetical protein